MKSIGIDIDIDNLFCAELCSIESSTSLHISAGQRKLDVAAVTHIGIGFLVTLRLHGVTLPVLDWDFWRQARIWLASSLNTGQVLCPSIRVVVWTLFMNSGMEMLSSADSHCDQISCDTALHWDCWRQTCGWHHHRADEMMIMIKWRWWWYGRQRWWWLKWWG